MYCGIEIQRNVNGIKNITKGHLLIGAPNKISITTDAHKRKGKMIKDSVIFAFALVLNRLLSNPLNVPTIVITAPII